MKHYLFGYGSLINKDSRLRTLPFHTSGIPALVKGYQRSWSYKCPRKSYTAVSVYPNPNHSVNGVLIPLSPSYLSLLDERELNYDRIQVSEKDIITQQQLKDSVVWIYVAKEPTLPSIDAPIPQTYLDCIIAGCLHYGEKFAADFLQLTHGWQTNFWINDRPLPKSIQKYSSHDNIDYSLIDHIVQKYLINRV